MSESTNILSGPKQQSIVPNISLGKYFFDCLKKRSANEVINIDAQTREVLTCGQLLEESIKFSVVLKTLNINKDDVISIISENSIRYCVIIVGALYAGVTVNPLNPGYKLKRSTWFLERNVARLNELKHAIQLSKPKAVFCTEKILDYILAINRDLEIIKNVVVMGNVEIQGKPEVELLQDLMAAVEIDTLTYKPEEFDYSEQVAFICQSSGTTGLPKGVMLTHKNLSTPIGYLSDPRFGNLVENDISIGILPFFHIFGLVLQIAAVITSIKLIIMDCFKPDVFLKAIQLHKVTKLYIVPTLLNFMVRNPVVKNFDTSSIKDIVCGGAPISKESQEQARKRFPEIKIRQVYGLTETCGGCTFQSGSEDAGSVGVLVPNVLAKVVDIDSQEVVGPNATGELRFKGSMMMKGYVGDETASKEAIDEDGFYRSGDIGYYNENGCFFLVDRLKDLIKYKGFQVPPAELEALINTHFGVLESGVIGVADERVGEKPFAFVVKKPEASITEQDIIDFVAEKISTQKHLYGGVKFTDEIPKNPAGKILRRRLREIYKEKQDEDSDVVNVVS